MTDNSIEKTTMDDAFQEGWFEIKTQAEIPVIGKQARVVEEVVISKKSNERAEVVRESLRRTVVETEKIERDDR